MIVKIRMYMEKLSYDRHDVNLVKEGKGSKPLKIKTEENRNRRIGNEEVQTREFLKEQQAVSSYL